MENYILRLAGHNMTLVALDGVEVDPIMVLTLNMYHREFQPFVLTTSHVFYSRPRAKAMVNNGT